METPATEDKKPKVTSYTGYIFGQEVGSGFWDEMLVEYKNMEDAIENAPSLQGNVTEVHENYIIIHFVTSGYPYGADCTVSLTPVFGDSYTDVSIGDEVVVYFNGDIMETDPLQLGTVYAITLKTPANRADAELSDIESIIVEYHGAGQIKKWSVSAELIDDVTEWYADLEYKKVEFNKGESPADGEGQTVYCLEFSDGTIFDYFNCGTEHYIRMGDIWYKVDNPKLPPVGEPV